MAVQLIGNGLEILSDDRLVIKNPKHWFHIHSYGQLNAVLPWAAREKAARDALHRPALRDSRMAGPRGLTARTVSSPLNGSSSRKLAKSFTHTTIEYPGALFKLSTPCPLISVEIDGVCTKPMSYLLEGEPKIGLPVRAWFRIDNPTNTILDLAWVPA